MPTRVHARMTVTLDGADAAVLATATEPDLGTDLPGATIARSGEAAFEVVGADPAAFRAACNTLLRLLATGAAVGGAVPADAPPEV